MIDHSLSHNNDVKWKMLALGVICGLALAAAGLLIYLGAGKSNSERHYNCVEIEKLKTAQRQEARSDFAQLDTNLMLLGVKKTPGIVKAATAQRDRKISRFKPKKCP